MVSPSDTPPSSTNQGPARDSSTRASTPAYQARARRSPSAVPRASWYADAPASRSRASASGQSSRQSKSSQVASQGSQPAGADLGSSRPGRSASASPTSPSEPSARASSSDSPRRDRNASRRARTISADPAEGPGGGRIPERYTAGSDSIRVAGEKSRRI